MNDIDAIAAQFQNFELWDTPANFMENTQRAKAFIICCQLDESANKRTLIKEYVDTYHSLTEQTRIIDRCAEKLSHSPGENVCKASLQSLKSARETIEA